MRKLDVNTEIFIGNNCEKLLLMNRNICLDADTNMTTISFDIKNLINQIVIIGFIEDDSKELVGYGYNDDGIIAVNFNNIIKNSADGAVGFEVDIFSKGADVISLDIAIQADAKNNKFITLQLWQREIPKDDK